MFESLIRVYSNVKNLNKLLNIQMFIQILNRVTDKTNDIIALNRNAHFNNVKILKHEINSTTI